jgi:hypothetical protein
MLAAALVSNQQQVVGVCKQICWGFKLLLPACWLLDYTGFQVLNASCIPAFKTAEQLEVASFCELANCCQWSKLWHTMSRSGIVRVACSWALSQWHHCSCSTRHLHSTRDALCPADWAVPCSPAISHWWQRQRLPLKTGLPPWLCRLLLSALGFCVQGTFAVWVLTMCHRRSVAC